MGDASLRALLAERERRIARLEVELRAALEEGDQARAAGSRLLAAANHEIRSPMSGILGMAELLLGTQLDAEQREFTETLDRSGRELLQVMEEIFDFARAEAGQTALECIPFELSAVVEAVGSMRAADLASRGFELVARVDPAPPGDLLGDPRRLTQILGFLARDALRSAWSGPLLIDARCGERTGDSVRVRLSVEAGRGDADGGFSLELAQRLAAGIGGRVGVLPRHDGGTLHFADLEVSVTGKPRRRAAPALQSLRVLIVDASETVLRVLSEQLDNLGALPQTADRDDRALARLARARQEGSSFHVALIDAQTPQGGGNALAAEIRRDPGLDCVALVRLSPAGAKVDTPARIAAGFITELAKPVWISDLERALSPLAPRVTPSQ